LNIIFIGGGNMATALIAGLQRARSGQVNISVADPSEEARKRMMQEFGVETYSAGHQAISDSDVIVLAVKPQMMPSVLAELAPVVEEGQLVLSIAAGTTVSRIQDSLGGSYPVVRAMPNTPALIGHGVCALFAGRGCRPHHREQAESIMNAAGEVIWVREESLMDVVTALSGSGPAYFFLLTEALARAGTELGLDEQDALTLAVRTAEGAGAMLLKGNEGPESLRKRVTSPGGTTQAAIETLEASEFSTIVRQAVVAATRRGRELAG
jgi:pyrroline-5-carboxylate reductase